MNKSHLEICYIKYKKHIFAYSSLFLVYYYFFI